MNGWNLSGQSRRCVTRTASTPLLFPTTSSPLSECTHTRQPLTSSMCTTRPFTAPTKYGRALLNVGASYNRHNIPTGSPRNMRCCVGNTACCWHWWPSFQLPSIKCARKPIPNRFLSIILRSSQGWAVKEVSRPCGIVDCWNGGLRPEDHREGAADLYCLGFKPES